MMRAGKDYGVEVVTAYENKQVGQVIYPPGLLRDRLVRCGLVRARTSDKEDAPPVKSANQAKHTLKLK